MLYKTGFPSLLLVITTASAVLLLNFKPKRKKNEKNSWNKKFKKNIL